MIRGLYTAVSGLITQEARESVITNNIANASTVGFKSDDISASDFGDILLHNYDKIVNGKNVENVLGSLSLGSKIDQTNTIFTQGNIQATDKPTDFAIEGRGFFTVLKQEGTGTKEYYTRNGHFHVNMNGYLADDSGNEVLGTNVSTGAVEPIKVDDSDIKCDSEGNIKLNDNAAYKFNIADFSDYKTLQKVGDNLYEGSNPTSYSGAKINQKSLEASNVNITNEIVNMMTVMRTFETNQKVVQTMDETLSKAVNEVGSVK